MPKEPAYPHKHLKPGDPASKVAKAYVMTVKMQQDYIKELKIRCGGNND